MRKLLLIPIALLLVACGSPRKACRKAERHIAKAAMMCPELMRSADQGVVIPGDSVAVEQTYGQADIDSIMAGCDQLREALKSEQDLSVVIFNHYLRRPRVEQAVAQVRRSACRYKPFRYEHELFTLNMKGGETPGIEVIVPQRKVVVPCPPQVELRPVVHTGVARWYRGAFWLLVVFSLLLIYIILRTVFLGMRTNDPQG